MFDERLQGVPVHVAQGALGVDLDAKNKQAKPKSVTVSDLCDDYIKKHAGTKRSGPEDVRRIERLVRPEFGSRDVKTIRYVDVENFHRKLSASAPIEANRVLALLSKMFSLAIKWEMIASNPCAGVEKNPEEERNRDLTKEEITRLIEAVTVFEKLKKQNTATCNAIRILMLTGARSAEVFSATWSMFELSEDAPSWTKPSSHTKRKRAHYVPLSEIARDLVTDMKKDRASSVFLFPSKSKSGRLTTIKHAWATILGIARITDLRVHDVRHVFAALLAAKKFSLQMIGKLLGHTQAKTTQRYSYLFVDDQRQAVNDVAVKI